MSDIKFYETKLEKRMHSVKKYSFHELIKSLKLYFALKLPVHIQQN